jgi:hypothetical protein
MICWRDLIICLSFSNLCFFNLWEVSASPWTYYFLPKAPPASLNDRFFPLLIVIVSFGTLLYVLLRLGRRAASPRVLQLMRWAAVGALVVPLNIVRTHVMDVHLGDVGITGGIPLVASFGLMGFAAVWMLVRRRRLMLRLPVILALAAAPLFPINVVHTLYKYYQGPAPSAFRDRANAPFLPVTDKNTKAVWLIFDAFDQHWAFEGRPSVVDLPELDRLKANSIFATRAQAPADNTVRSMPALITGRRVNRVKHPTPDELWIEYEGSTEWLPWSRQDNIFLRARRLGYNSGLAGYWNPYGRVIGHTLNTCHWANSVVATVQAYYFKVENWKFLRYQLTLLPLWTRITPPAVQNLVWLNWATDAQLGKSGRAAMAKDYQHIRDGAIEILKDSRIQLVMIHWPAPHPPGFYNRRRYTLSPDLSNGYFDNLALVDRTIAEVRRVLEDLGDWERTILLVSSDHSLGPSILREHGQNEEDEHLIGRRQYPYVPFLLKLKGQQQFVPFDRPFNTVISGDLLLKLLSGELTTPAEVIGWLRSKALPEGGSASESAR